MKSWILGLATLLSLALAAAETPREVLDKTQFANKVWDAIPLLTEERKADEPDIGLDEMPGEDMVSLEDAKAAYDWSKPPKGEWGQCASIGDRTLKPVSRTSKNVVRYPPVGDFRKECSRSTWYRNEMAIPADWQGRQIRIYAWLWGMDALVFVNGKKAGRILRPRADVDVTDLVKPGGKCAVEVLMSTDRVRDEAQKKWFEERYWKDWRCHQFEFRSYDGNAYLSDVFANASVRGRKLTLESEVNCRKPGEYRLKATFTDMDGKVAKSLDEKLTLKKGFQTVKPIIQWEDPHLWELRAPYLYKCEVVLCDAGGHPLQSCRRVISEVATFKTAQLADPEAVEELLKAQPVDKWKKKSNPHLKEERALKHLDVRVVGILAACTIKLGKPRPDGTPGQKWAILQIDDGSGGFLDAFCFAKAWEKHSAVESCVDQLVMLSGEVAYRVNYGKDDKFDKRHPEVGDLNFTVREARPLSDALAELSTGLRIRLKYDDPGLADKAVRIRQAVVKSPGRLPVFLEIVNQDGTQVEVDLGPAARVAVTVGFLSELAKIVPQADTSFHPSDKVYLDPPERKPWE